MPDVNAPPARPYGIAPPDFALPAATHLGRVVLQIADLDRSIRYYESVIGLRVIHRAAGVATLGPPDGPVLVELRERRDARAVPRRGLLGLYHFAILLPDRPALGRFLAHLATIGQQPGMSDHLVSEALYLTDPDGLGIEVYADKPRSEWRHADRQLTMASDPLDARSVIAAANGEPWSGAPAGTVMGHVHLYVSDLGKAEEFYHLGLGFDKMVWSYPGALFMAAGGYHHHLGTNTWAQGAMPATEEDARLIEWTVVVPTVRDADTVAANLRSREIPVANEEGDSVVQDPWGVGVRIVGNREPGPGNRE